MGAESFEDILYLIDFKFCTSLNERKIMKSKEIPENFMKVFKKFQINPDSKNSSKVNSISLRPEGNFFKY